MTAPDPGPRPADAGPDAPRISPVAEADVSGLADLMAASPLLQRYGTTRESALVAIEHGRRHEDLILVARDDAGSPVGLAWVVESRALARSAYLRLILVAGNRQGTGLGTRLLAAAEWRARDWANHLFLLVTTDNARARRLYERSGYRHVGDLPAFAHPAIDESLYEKPLRPHGDRLPS